MTTRAANPIERIAALDITLLSKPISGRKTSSSSSHRITIKILSDYYFLSFSISDLDYI